MTLGERQTATYMGSTKLLVNDGEADTYMVEVQGSPSNTELVKWFVLFNLIRLIISPRQPLGSVN